MDERLAARIWPDESPIGKRIRFDPDNDGSWLTIVGVNSHIVRSAPLGGVAAWRRCTAR